MSYLFGATCIVGITFMVTFMFIGLWLFVVALKAFHNLKYKTFLLEKIYRKLDNFEVKDTNNNTSKHLDINDGENISELNNIKNIK
ncbi:hypothetical protein NNC19_22890 [Clostridium sp. SHJSY1]|uniref:hypothetical protein n=1 Tax=Clostridium sp. SHJSY1 TaxID=2942483 RepID=UPI00287632A6|nr:hypothetical protein [Clostridium sp. SHJSY1]MDS0528528.1 hypothetical protein [Clostridium sp. SHJSY1]